MLGLALASCGTRTYVPETIAEVGFLERAQSQSTPGLRVRASVPSAEETRRLFQVPVYDRGVQPVWIEITNDLEQHVRFAPVGVDATYYSPFEVAYMFKGRYSSGAYAELEEHLYESAMVRRVEPGETRSGFVFTHFRSGTKAFNVDVYRAEPGSESFSFFVTVPGLEPDHSAVSFESIHSPDEIRELDEVALRMALRHVGITTDRTGERAGLPFNVVLIGDGKSVLRAMLRSGFVERTRAEVITENDREQYWERRPPDAIFRAARARAASRGETNELRVWRSAMTFEGKPVWLGQITHFLGRSTELARALFDPRVDPDMDDARLFLLQRLWYSQALERFAWQDCGERIRLDDERSDFRGVTYFTTGVRVVLWPSDRPVSQEDTVLVQWDSVPGSGEE